MILSKSYKKIMDKIYVDDKMKERILQNIETRQIEKSNKKNNSKNSSRNKIYLHINRKTSICAAAILLIFCLTVPTKLSGVFDLKIIHHQKKDTTDILEDDVSSDLKTSNKNSATTSNNTKTGEDSNNLDSDAEIILKDKDSSNSDSNAEIMSKDKDSSNSDSDTEGMSKDKDSSNSDSNTEMLSEDENVEFAEYSSAKELSKNIGFQITDIPTKILPYKISEKLYYNYGDGLAEIQYVSEKAQYIVYRKQSVSNADISGDYSEYSDVTTMKIQSVNICLKGEQNKYNLATWSKGKYSYSLYFSDAITEKNFQNILKIAI